MLALFCVVGYLVFTSAKRLPVISQERFDAAHRLWEEHGPKSYEIEVKVQGPQAAVYRVQIRHGELASATRNGEPLPLGRTRGIWSVPGMFSTIEIDLAHSGPSGNDETGVRRMQVTPLGTFDPQYGYPSRYRRVEWGSPMEASWEVTFFRPLD